MADLFQNIIYVIREQLLLNHFQTEGLSKNYLIQEIFIDDHYILGPALYAFEKHTVRFLPLAV